jgi:AcrR family transcriptional regulator
MAHDDEPRSGRRRRADGEISRQKILDAATEIAAERGYEGASIGAVSAKCGLPASSIYWHFKDKDALLAAVIDHSFESWLTNAGGSKPTPENGSVGSQLTSMMQRTAKALQESSDFLRLGLMLTLERREVEPTARRRFLAVRDEVLARTVATYGRLFPELDEAAHRQLGMFTMATADGLFINAEIEGDSTDTVAAFELLAVAVRSAANFLQKKSPASASSVEPHAHTRRSRRR